MHIEGFDIIGIKTRTANDGRAGKDIPMLWNTFMETNVKDRIPNKLNDSIYCLYSNYELMSIKLIAQWAVNHCIYHHLHYQQQDQQQQQQQQQKRMSTTKR